MKRRTFLGMGAAATAVSVSGSVRGSEGGGERPVAAAPAPPVLATYSADDHRRRLENIAHAHQHVRRAMRKHLVTSYLPGQCCYNLGEYPCVKPWEPDEWDERELDRLARPRHPLDPGPRGVERFAAAVRLPQARGAQSGRLSPIRRHGTPARHEADRLRLQRLLRPEGPRFPPGVGRGPATSARSTSSTPTARRRVPVGGRISCGTSRESSTTTASTDSTTTSATRSRAAGDPATGPGRGARLRRKPDARRRPGATCWG